jgi:hypothetical protein
VVTIKKSKRYCWWSSCLMLKLLLAVLQLLFSVG